MEADEKDTLAAGAIMRECLEALSKFIKHGSANYRASHREDWKNVLAEVESGACRFQVTLDEAGGALQLSYCVVPNQPNEQKPLFYLRLEKPAGPEPALH